MARWSTTSNFVLSGELTGLSTRAEEQLKKFKTLPIGWHYGEGVAPNTETLSTAFKALQLGYSYGLSDARAFPGIDGEVMLVFGKGGEEFEVTIEPDNSMDVTYHVDQQTVEAQPKDMASLTMTLVRRKISKVKECRTFASSTPCTSTTIQVSSVALPSNRRPAGSQLSTKAASATRDLRYAVISAVSIPPTSVASPRSSGASRKRRIRPKELA